MIFSSFSGLGTWSARAGLLVTLVLAAASAGCGQRVCIEWSENEGVCPSSAETKKEHLGKCTNVTSVDGDPVREGNLCCYPVTKQGPLPDCFDETTSTGRPTPSVTTGSISNCDNQGFCGTFLGVGGCSSCAINNKCGKAFNICQSTNACSNIIACVSTCFEGDPACLLKCEKPNPDGLADFRALSRCVFCDECQNDCFSSHAAECNESTTSSGLGGAGGMSGIGGAGGMSGIGGAGGMSGMGGAGGKGTGP